MASSTSTPPQSLPTNIPPPSFLKSKPNNINFITFPPFSSSSKLRLRIESHSTAAGYNEVVVDEEMDKIRRLQNGSDIRGVALDGEKGRQVDLTPPAVEAIAESFGEWVAGELERESRGGGVRVSLGRDPRISGGVLSTAVFAGLARAGCEVFDMGLATTPACFMSTLLPPFVYHASIMVRNGASHTLHAFLHIFFFISNYIFY